MDSRIYTLIFFAVLGITILIVSIIDKKKKRERDSRLNNIPRIDHYNTLTAAEMKGREGEQLVSYYLSHMKGYVINDIILDNDSGHTCQIDHIFINQNGIFCIETKNYGGKIYGKDTDKYWTQWFNKDKTQEVVNAIAQNNYHCKYLHKILSECFTIYSVVVFVNNNAPKNSSAINLEDLYGTLNYYRGQKLSITQIDNIYCTILNHRSGRSLQEHINNIKEK